MIDLATSEVRGEETVLLSASPLRGDEVDDLGSAPRVEVTCDVCA